MRIYWFDDEESEGGCRIPKSWRLLYWEEGTDDSDDSTWKPVWSTDGFPVAKDGWNEVHFEPVKTTKVRLEMVAQDSVSVGVHEWEIK